MAEIFQSKYNTVYALREDSKILNTSACDDSSDMRLEDKSDENTESCKGGLASELGNELHQVDIGEDDKGNCGFCCGEGGSHTCELNTYFAVHKRDTKWRNDTGQ